MARSDQAKRIPLDVSVPRLAGPEPDDRFPTTELGYCLVTGGAGYLGRNLVYELIRRGERVRVFDRVPIDYSHSRLDAVLGDLRQAEDLRKACQGIDTVFHTAAVLDFHGFATRRQREESFSVNVTGVENLVHACLEEGVKRLVHTSSNNVTLDGPVIDGDESRPYAANPRDLYTETKIRGEQAALAANGGGGLLSCAIRPGGIYGPGDGLMLPRVVEECASGKFVATIGDGTALSDNTYIDNLVDGQIEAARHLVPARPWAVRPTSSPTALRSTTSTSSGRSSRAWASSFRRDGCPAGSCTRRCGSGSSSTGRSAHRVRRSRRSRCARSSSATTTGSTRPAATSAGRRGSAWKRPGRSASRTAASSWPGARAWTVPTGDGGLPSSPAWGRWGCSP